MSVTISCEVCGGETRTRGYGCGVEYVRMHRCKDCGNVFYTSETQIFDFKEGKRRYNEYRNEYMERLKEKDEQG